MSKFFVCRGCTDQPASLDRTTVDISDGASIELVDKFCYLGDMLIVDGDADAAMEHTHAPMHARMHACMHTRTHAHTHNHFMALLDFVWDYLDEPAPEMLNQSGFTAARDSEWQWHQLGHMQICTLIQRHNHASIPPLSFLQAECPSCHSTNSVKALKARQASDQNP